MTLDVLPAQEGDALLLACRSRNRVHHVLIDAGTPFTAPAAALAEEYRYRVAGPTPAGSGVSIRLSG